MENILTTKIVDGVLTISIGLEELAFAVENGPDWYGDYKIDPTDGYKEFGKSIFYALQTEEEDGTTPIHRLFDSATEYALDQGYEGFIENESKE